MPGFPLTLDDAHAIWLTLKLATVTTILLLVLATPLAWWLARSGSRWSGMVGAVVALPLVLPPTVLGFYLLVSMGPQGWVGQFTAVVGCGFVALYVCRTCRRFCAVFAALCSAASAECV